VSQKATFGSGIVKPAPGASPRRSSDASDQAPLNIQVPKPIQQPLFHSVLRNREAEFMSLYPVVTM
jgi:hypothetical protein